MPLAFRLASFYFAYFAFVGAFMPYFPLYLAARQLSAGEIAFVIALPQLARIFAPAAWGWLADRSGARRGIVVFSCAAMAAGLAALPAAAGLAGIAAIVAAMSVLSAGALPLVETITLAALAGQSGRYGPIRLWGSIGFIVTVLAGGAWLDTLPAISLAWLFVALALAALAGAAVLPGKARVAAQSAPAADSGRGDPAAARALLGAGFCMAVAHGALYAFFTLHLERIGYSGAAIGVLWTLGVLAEIAVFLYLPALFRRFALSAILVASFACAALRFAAIGWGAEILVVLVLAQLLHAGTFGAFHAASVAAIARVFPAGAQARGQTLFSSVCYGAGGALGVLLAGWAWEAGGAALTFALASLAGAAGGVLAWRLRRAGL